MTHDQFIQRHAARRWSRANCFLLGLYAGAAVATLVIIVADFFSR